MLARHPKMRRQAGLSLVELMVGITVGLIVTAGASIMALGQINEHRRLMLETQLQQDLRAAAELIQQDFRRIGFRGDATVGTWVPAGAIGSLSETAERAATTSAYNGVSTVKRDDIGRQLNYQYALPDSDRKYGTGALRNHENLGVRWAQSSEQLDFQLGMRADGSPNWQPLTDPEVLRITDFRIQLYETKVPAGEFCEMACGVSGAPACPEQLIRRIEFKITGTAKHDSNVVRSVSGVEFVRANAASGVCPS
jgi:type II secretory pathway pseudopilin PulG